MRKLPFNVLGLKAQLLLSKCLCYSPEPMSCDLCFSV